MKIICLKQNLIDGINIVQKAVPNKSALTILEGILLEADDKLKLTGNDLEIGIEAYIEADVQKPGTIVLDSKVFGEIIRRMPDAEVLIEVKENNKVVVECDNSRFDINGIPAVGFPAIPTIRKENAFSIKQGLIKEMIKQTIFAVGTDENRPVLTGALIECKDKELTVVSVDGYRLALRKNNVDSKIHDFSVIVPGRTLNEITKILQYVDDEMTVYNTHNQIIFDMENCRVVSRLLEGKYLNYNSLVPKEYETKMAIDKKEFLASVERAALIATEEKKYPVKLEIKNGKVVISSSTEVGAVRDVINIDMEGNDIIIGFNPRYLIDALRAIDDEKINACFATSVGPCTIRPFEGDGYAYMIGAVRI